MCERSGFAVVAGIQYENAKQSHRLLLNDLGKRQKKEEKTSRKNTHPARPLLVPVEELTVFFVTAGRGGDSRGDPRIPRKTPKSFSRSPSRQPRDGGREERVDSKQDSRYHQKVQSAHQPCTKKEKQMNPLQKLTRFFLAMIYPHFSEKQSDAHTFFSCKIIKIS